MNTLKPKPTREEIALADLRSRIGNLISEDTKLADDLYLLGWLKNSNFKISRAEQGIRDSVNWRKENNVDILLDEDLDAELSKDFKIYLDSVTQEGLPIVFVSIGDLDKFEKNRVLQHCNHVFLKFEKLVLDFNRKKYNELCEKAGMRIPITADSVVGGLGLIDCKTFNLTDLRSPRVLQMCLGATRAAVNYFPGLASVAYFINMNKFFQVCFKVLKPILNVSSMKLETFDGNKEIWTSALLEIIDKEELPLECGGYKIHN